VRLRAVRVVSSVVTLKNVGGKVETAYGIIYCATSISTGKKYVGQTTKGLETRRLAHEKGDNPGLGRAIREQGTLDFTWEVIATASTPEDLNRLERGYIVVLDTLSPNGYNLVGGVGNIVDSVPRVAEKTVLSSLDEALLGADARKLPPGLSVRERAHLRVQWRVDAIQANPHKILKVVGPNIVEIDGSDDGNQ